MGDKNHRSLAFSLAKQWKNPLKIGLTPLYAEGGTLCPKSIAAHLNRFANSCSSEIFRQAGRSWKKRWKTCYPPISLVIVHTCPYQIGRPEGIQHDKKPAKTQPVKSPSLRTGKSPCPSAVKSTAKTQKHRPSCLAQLTIGSGTEGEECLGHRDKRDKRIAQRIPWHSSCTQGAVVQAICLAKIDFKDEKS